MKSKSLFNIVSRFDNFNVYKLQVAEEYDEGWDKLSRNDRKFLLLNDNILNSVVECTGGKESLFVQSEKTEQSIALWKLKLEYNRNILPAFNMSFDLSGLELWFNEILTTEYIFDVNKDDLILSDSKTLLEADYDLGDWLSFRLAKELETELKSKGLSQIPLCPNGKHPFISVRKKTQFCSNACQRKFGRMKLPAASGGEFNPNRLN